MEKFIDLNYKEKKKSLSCELPFLLIYYVSVLTKILFISKALFLNKNIS
jgi:hypothetical protein